MKNLRKSNYFFLMMFFLVGCSTGGYHVHYQNDATAELILSSDRILMECEWLHDADYDGLYGFMMHVLDNENTVFTAIQGNTLDKKSCDNRLKKIGKILREGRNIYFLGFGNLADPKKVEKKQYTFPGRGTFYGDGRVLKFMAIANENGSCYDAYSGEKANPCPPEPFPTQK